MFFFTCPVTFGRVFFGAAPCGARAPAGARGRRSDPPQRRRTARWRTPGPPGPPPPRGPPRRAPARRPRAAAPGVTQRHTRCYASVTPLEGRECGRKWSSQVPGAREAEGFFALRAFSR
eukprot:7384994-Pyramimonas_sp.AAC.1